MFYSLSSADVLSSVFKYNLCTAAKIPLLSQGGGDSRRGSENISLEIILNLRFL